MITAGWAYHAGRLCRLRHGSLQQPSQFDEEADTMGAQVFLRPLTL
jgi:hypothetical protein